MTQRILTAFLLLASSALTVGADPVPMPEYKLLLPYFEVSLESSERLSFFAVTNWSDDQVDATAKVYTNWGIPVLDIPFTLGPKEVASIGLREWIVNGRLLEKKTVCSNGENDCLDLRHVQAALSGQASPLDQLFYATASQEKTASGDTIASGFVIIEVHGAGFQPDAIWGDFFYADPAENYAQGLRLVRLEPKASECDDLCKRHSLRFLEGGSFSGGTKLSVWSWDGVEGHPSSSPSPGMEYGDLKIDVYNEDGELIEVIPHIPTLATQALNLSDWNLTEAFGWLDLNTSESSTIAAYYRASGRFSVGVPSWCLPCDPCNPDGPCYDPGNPTCSAVQCVPARLHITGDSAGLVGQPFSLNLNTTGTPIIQIEVSDLPDGLQRRGSNIFGTPTEAGSFTITAENSCRRTSIEVDIVGVPSSLTLVKEVINDDGGTATVSDFALFIDDQRVQSGVANDLPPGSYRASERNLPGYAASRWSGDCAPDGSVDLGAGEHKTCYITNDDKPTKLTLVKHVDNRHGGTARVSDFALFVDDQRVQSGVANTFPSGTYRASEQNLPGYAASPWGGDCAADGSVTLVAGDHKVCTITNYDEEPPKAKLTLIKHVVNRHGGTARVSDFALFVDDQRVQSGVHNTFPAGTYRASEQNLPGYTASPWGGDCAADGRVTLAAGDHKVCEITNYDKEPPEAKLTLVKHVDNRHGGTATVSDFALFVDDQRVQSGVHNTLPPGTYRASEQNLPGYTAGPWGGDCAADGRVTLAAGDHKVCTITNYDQPAKLTLIKHVINDDGGTARVSDFALFIDDQRVQSGVANTLSAGSYRASEQNLPGYTAGPWGGDCSADGSVTLAAGEHKVCQITNDDKPPVCEEVYPPEQSISNPDVDYNDPHNGSHWVKVSFSYRIQGEFDGEVQIFWKNGGSTFIKKKVSVDQECEDGVTTGTLRWESTSRSHHPGHGARYFARFVVGGQVVQSIPLN